MSCIQILEVAEKLKDQIDEKTLNFGVFSDKFHLVMVIQIKEPSYIFPNYQAIFIIKQYQNQMSERRAWTQEEDRVLKYLKDVLQIKKWSEISRKMECDYNIPGRNGKQCRQRYTNHLDSSIISEEFTLQEEEKLFLLHNNIGNRWSHISKQFRGRTDNHIKNHFHSKLRKGIRKLNKQIKQHFKKTYKPYKLTIIYKIVEASDYRLAQKPLFAEEDLRFFNDLKNFLLQYAGGQVQKTQLSEMRDKQQVQFLIRQLQRFESFFKNKKNAASKKENFPVFPLETFSEESKRNVSTSHSECNSQMEAESGCEFNPEGQLIYEDVSFQFVGALDSRKYIASGEKQVLRAPIVQNAIIKHPSELNQERLETKNYYSFLKIQKEQNMDCLENQSALEGLVEQKQVIEFGLEKKFSLKSFESLREYEDSYLNQSEFNMVLKRFDSFSNIEEGLFE